MVAAQRLSRQKRKQQTQQNQPPKPSARPRTRAVAGKAVAGAGEAVEEKDQQVVGADTSLTSLAPNPPNAPAVTGDWDVTRKLLPQKPPENLTEPLNPYDANIILDWLLLGTHLKGGNKPGEQQYGPNGESFVLWLNEMGVSHVINVAAEHDDTDELKTNDLHPFKLWWPDDDKLPPQYIYQPPLQDFVAALRFVIESNAEYTSKGRRIGVYVHCHGGKHRASLMAVFLVAVFSGVSVQTALRLVETRRIVIKLRDTPGYLQTVSDAVRAVRPLLNPLTPINALPALDRLARSLPPPLECPPPGYTVTDDNDTYFLAPDGTLWDAGEGTIVRRGAAPASPATEEQQGATARPGDAPGDTAGDDEAELRGSVIAAYACTPLEEQALTVGIYGAMRTSFLARWCELGREGDTLPQDARDKLFSSARDAAIGFCRSHNRGIALVASEAAQRYAAAPGARMGQTSLAAAMRTAALQWLKTKRAALAARTATYQTGLATQFADLFVGDRNSVYRVVSDPTDAATEASEGAEGATEGEAAGAGCSGCRAYMGRDLTRQSAWHFVLYVCHPGCSHRVQLVVPAPVASR